MLKRLKIQNLLLIKEAEVLFDKGFTIITGETGSGKTIFLDALKLACGKRAENHLVREGALKAVIEAEFDEAQRTATLLDLAGIDWDSTSPLVLKREIAKEGKNRAFINCQMATLALLEQIADQLIDFTDQHAQHALKASQTQKDFLDRFGDLQDICSQAKSGLLAFKESSQTLNELKEQKESQSKLLQEIEEQIEEIATAKLYDGEEEQIEAEHKRLCHIHDLSEKGAHLEKTTEALLVHAKKASQLMQQMGSFDASLTPLKNDLSEICLNLSEVSRSLLSYTSKLEADPKHFAYLEERLQTIDTLKRKYQHPLQHLAKLQEKKEHSLNLDVKIEAEESLTARHLEKAKQFAALRFEKRSQAAALLSKEISSHLKKLNIPHAEFFIELVHEFEEDTIDFFMKANLGHPMAALKDQLSGGELSRVMIALQLALGKKFPKPILIFDEIDSSIGGQTASGIGEAFLKLGQSRQVIAITHFPQVAKLATHHIRLYKHSSNKQTITLLETLTPEGRAKELSRMLGEKQII